MQQVNLCFKCNKPGHRAFECLERDGEDKGGEISDIRNNSRAQMDDTENEEPAKRLDEERMKESNETNTSPEEGERTQDQARKERRQSQKKKRQIRVERRRTRKITKRYAGRRNCIRGGF